MLGKKFYKSNYDLNEYIQCSAWCNSNNATIVDKGEYYECVSLPPAPEPSIEDQINALKSELATYDYIGIKIAMGVATQEEYADKIAYTQELRQRINELEEHNE